MVFVCSWAHGQVFAYERCQPTGPEVSVSGASTVLVIRFTFF